MSKKDEIFKLLFYYQEFHHKCVSWYVTIMGFFIAGIIAAATPISHKLILGVLFILAGTAISIIFSVVIFHYGARIEKLNQYIKQDNESKIPDSWYSEHKKVAISLDGVGSLFFLVIIICLWLIVFMEAIIKFFC